MARALRLLNESGLEEGGVEALASRLGIGSRHLRRLFLQHLGASPRAVEQTRRLQFAKKLIDETSLSMSEVAEAAGYGSVRRFNASIQSTYHRTPSRIRSLAHHTETQDDDYEFRLRYRPPYYWPGILAFLAARATPGVELVEEGRYSRSILLDGEEGMFQVAHAPQQQALVARVRFPAPSALFAIIERIRRMFDLDADWMTIAANLKNEPLIAKRLQSLPGLRVPGCWDGFELAVRAILGQQISVQAATCLAGRLVQFHGNKLKKPEGLSWLFPRPERLASAAPKTFPLPAKRAETIRSLARAVCDGDLCFQHITNAQEFSARLREISGIGRWTAEYIAMRALGEPDAFPSGDLGLQRTLQVKTPVELERRSELWRPWRAYATMYLWSEGH